MNRVVHSLQSHIVWSHAPVDMAISTNGSYLSDTFVRQDKSNLIRKFVAIALTEAIEVSMKRRTLLVLFIAGSVTAVLGQVQLASITAPSAGPGSTVPLTVSFGATLLELSGVPAVGVQKTAFVLYPSSTGGEPLWSETQFVTTDNQGHFSILLGAATEGGIPSSVFVNGLPRWVGVTPSDGVERTRVAISSVPYAMKSSDADTLGGTKASDYVTVEQLNTMLGGPTSSANPSVAGRWPIQLMPSASMPTYQATSPTGPSFMSLALTGPPLQVISETMVSHLNVDLLHGLTDEAFAKISQGNIFSQIQTFAGGINLPAISAEADAPNMLNSASLNFESSTTDAQTGVKSTQTFSWISQPSVGPDGTQSAKLTLFYSANGSQPVATGLSINADGTINFPTTQQFAGGGISTINSGNSQNWPNPGSPNSPVVETAIYNWNANPQVGIQVGSNSVTLAPCPRGVNWNDLWHYLYIGGTGTPEVVLITGGTCLARASGGTLEFNAAYAHPVGFTLGTSSDGIQEAIIDAAMPNSGGKVSRQVTIDPGSHLLRARVSIRSSSITITSSGAILTCAMSDTCIMAGDPANGDLFQNIVLQGLNVAPGVVGGEWPAIEDNAQGSNISNVAPQNSSVTGASFGSLVQIDNDQSAVIDRLTTTTSYTWARCDKTFCSSAILGPGPFYRNAGVLQVQNSNLSLQCAGNGIDNQDGNTLSVSNTVVQGAAEFGIRASTVYQQNTVTLNTVYGEQDGTCNPLGTGAAGLIVEGGQANETGSNPAGALPQFANTGSVTVWYYIVVHSSTDGTSSPYLAGLASTTGVGPINVVWNQVGDTGTISYDVLRQTGNGGVGMTVPNGTGEYAVATGLLASNVCVANVCSFLDNAESAPATYAVSINPAYWPSLKLWPGNIILTQTADLLNGGGGNPTSLYTDNVTAGAITNSAGSTYPSVFAQECNPLVAWSTAWAICTSGNSVGNDNPAVGAQVIQLVGTGGSPGGYKGRLIYTMSPTSWGTNPTHVITLADSNATKTLATQPGVSPTWDTNDTYIGFDAQTNGTQTQLSIGASVAISSYIANTGDNVHYLERLTANAKTFQVPVQLDTVPYGNLALLLNPVNGSMIYCVDCMNVADDHSTFDSNAAPGGHGTNLLYENGQWRVH